MRRVALYDVGNPWCGVKLDLLDRISLTHKYVFPPRFEQVPYMEKARSGVEILPLSKLFQKDMLPAHPRYSSKDYNQLMYDTKIKV